MRQGGKSPALFYSLFLATIFGTLLAVSVSSRAAAARITAPAGWNMLALPVSPDNGPASCSIFGDTAFAVGNGTYINCGPSLPPAPGRGFLVFLNAPLDSEISGTPAPTTRVFKIRLQQGWNLIGNPFFEQVPLSGLAIENTPFSQSTDITPELYEQSATPGEYTPAPAMLPYRAYFIFANRAVTLGVSICAAAGCEPDLPEGQDPSLFSPSFNLSTPREQQPGAPPYVSGQAVLAMAPGTTSAAAAAFISPTGAQLAGANASAGVFLAALPSGVSPQSYITSITGSPWLVSAAPNYILSPAAVPDDPPYISGAPAQQRWGFDAINMPAVWKEFTPAAQPVIAIIDTGVDRNNPDLAGRVLPGKNFLDPSAPDSYSDDNGHGTAVSAIAAAAGGNSQGIAGVCWHCRVLPLKACDSTGSCPMFAVLNAVSYAAKNGANVINLSLGANFPAVSSSANAVHAVFADAAMRGIVIVAAAGNSNTNASTFLPGADPFAISVGAMAQNETRLSSSNYGPVVDAAAPGENILTLSLNGAVQYISGTSAAAPFISGLAGLALSLYPGMSPNTLRKAISSTSDPLQTDQPVGPKANALKLFQSLSANNLPPSITSLTPDSPWTLPGQTIRIVAQASDPENRPLSFDWSASSGLISASGPVAVWTAPLNRGDVTITVGVRDTFNADGGPLSIRIPVLQGGLYSVKIEPAILSIAPGSGAKLTAYAVDSPAQSGLASPIAIDPQWSIDSPIATLAQDGSLAALAQGRALISATFAQSHATAQLDISQNPVNASMNTAADGDPCILDWPKFRCNHAGNNTYSGSSAAPYFIRWTSVMPTYVHSSAVSKNGKLYVIDSIGNLAQIDISTGVRDWLDPGPAGAIRTDSTPIIIGNYLYISDGRGYLIRYNTTIGPASKTTLFSTPLAPNDLAWASLEGETQGSTNTIYLISNRVFALDDSGGAASATLKWAYPPASAFGAQIQSSPILININGQQTLVFGAPDHKTYALNASTGVSIWPPVDLGSSMIPAPTYSSNYGGRIYIGNDVGTLRAIDAQTGSTAWTFPGGVKIDAPAAVSGTMIYTADITGGIRAIRDNGAAYDSSVWPAPASIPGCRMAAPLIVTDNELIAIPAPTCGTLTVIDPSNGAIKWKYPGPKNITSVHGFLALKRHPTQNDMELYIATGDGPVYAMEKNFPPQITLFGTSSPVPPAGTPPSAASATIYAKATDPNGLSDLNATMTLDLSSIGGSSAQLLYDDGTHGDPAAADGEFYNNSEAAVPPGFASGPYPLFATASDKGGLTATAQYNFLVSEATPSIVSASFSPAYIQKGGSASTTLTVVISDLNSSIGSVQVDLDPVNGPAGAQLVSLACGAFDSSRQATCSASGITANAAATSSPPNALLTVRASDSVNSITAPASLEILGLDHFTATATTPVIAGTNSTITITAWDKYNALYTTYSNTNPIKLSAAGFSTATTITWSGTGVTNNPGAASGTLASGNFTNGSATANVTNTKAETLSLSATEQDTGTAIATSTSATWTPAPLSRIAIRIAPNGGGYEVGSYSMDIGQTLPLWCAGYDAFANFISDQNCDWNLSGSLSPAPAPGQYQNFNFSPSSAGQSGLVSATSTNGALTDSTALVQVSGLMPNSPSLSAANASGSVQLSWASVTSYNDSTFLDPSSVKYEIYRTTTFGGSLSDPYVLITTTASGAITYTDAAVALYTKYYYVAATIDPQGRKSRYSNIASVITAPPPFVYKQTCGDQVTGSFVTNSSPGFFNRPASVAVDASDNIYVADMYNNRIQKFDKNCNFLWAKGKFGSAAGTFKLPNGVAYNPANGFIYVTDYYNRAQAFDSSGNYQFSVTAPSPAGITADTTGNLYITSSSGQLLKTTPTGSALLTITGLNSPRGVAVTSGGDIYIVENGAGKISKFSPGGVRSSTTIGSYGTTNGKLNSPNGLCADPGGNLYVSDTYNDRIQVFSPSGVLANIIGTSGQDHGQLRRPTGAYINSSGNLVAADNYNNRVQEYTKP